MYKSVIVSIKGVSPLLMHNGQLANPRNKFAAALKEFTPKKRETDQGAEQSRRLEFLGGLYMGPNGPIIPGENLEAMMRGAATKVIKKGGKAAVLSGVLIDENPDLIYDGPRTAEGLFADSRFTDHRAIRIPSSGSRVMRTRPRFDAWGLKFTIQYLPDVIDEKTVINILLEAGRSVGLGDYKPKFGRFVIV